MRILLLVFFSLITLISSSQVEQLDLLGRWSDSTLIPSVAHNNTYNEIWGYATDGHEYAILGSTWGTHIIDVTEATQPIEVFAFQGAISDGRIIHRDYHDHEGFLYAISDEGSQNTLQIIDLRQLPDTAIVAYDSGESIRRAHNIFIDTTRSFMYALIGRDGAVDGTDPMRIYDISDPLDPQFIRSYNRIGPISFSQVHDAYIDRDTAFLNLGPSGFMIAEFSDPQEPNLISYLSRNDYPQAGYNHSGWPSEDGNYYYMADENFDFDLKVVDIRNMEEPTVVGTFDAEADHGFSIPHNQLVYCNRLYVSYYYEGLQVYDISEPSDPQRLYHYPTSTETPRSAYRGAWGVYPYLPSGNILVSDMQEGLFILADIEEECSPLTSTENIDSNKDWQLWPNPASHSLYYSLPSGVTQGQIVISDISGRILLRQSIQGESILNTNLLPSGYYTISLSSEDIHLTKKLVINNF